jgi:hypothetical protein
MKRGCEFCRCDRGQCLEGKDTTGRPRGPSVFTELMEFLFNYFLYKPVSFISSPQHYILKIMFPFMEEIHFETKLPSTKKTTTPINFILLIEHVICFITWAEVGKTCIQLNVSWV